MRILEVRRHSMRQKPGVHLTQEGVRLARRVGESMGKFNLVVTSTLDRTVETAIAMGYAVDEQRKSFSTIPDDAVSGLLYPSPFIYLAEQIQYREALAQWARGHVSEWYDIVRSVPEGGAALIISHGIMIEVGTGMLMPDVDYSTWGKELNFCEGVRLAFENGKFLSIECLRV